MAVFTYRAIDQDGAQREGTIDAVTMDVAITALQRRGLVISFIEPDKKQGGGGTVRFFERVKNSDIVVLSRQIATLFEAQVSPLRIFQLLATEARTPLLSEKLSRIASDIQGGASLSVAFSHQPDMFSPFYVNMVKAGEEAGKLDETFLFLADYLDRNYEITQKAKNALIYPAFIVATFITVMTLVMTMIIPKLAVMLKDSGQEIPIYTKIVISLSSFLTDYLFLIVILLILSAVFFIRFLQTEAGKIIFAQTRLQIPIVGDIYRKLFMSRIADNLSTMLRSGVQILRALEITSEVVDDPVYGRALRESAAAVASGSPVSDAFRAHPEIPGIVVVMIKVGEESGNMARTLDTMAKFYRREVGGAVDTLVGLIEPIMIVGLALGVGVLLASVMIPLYNIASSF